MAPAADMGLPLENNTRVIVPTSLAITFVITRMREEDRHVPV